LNETSACDLSPPLFGLLPRQDPLSEYHMYANPTDVTISKPHPGADSGFQVRWGGGALRKIAPSGGRRENFGVFRVKNHDFMQKNLIFSNFRGGTRAGCAPPPPGSAPGDHSPATACFFLESTNTINICLILSTLTVLFL
jgi:hypothetical protein